MKMNCFASVTALILVAGFCATAQCPKQDWREKVKAEKIAFFTNELSLSAKEAQDFWPVYNEIEAEKNVARDSSFAAWRRMKTAESSEKDLNAYLACQKKIAELDIKAADKYKKVLPKEKVAKVFVAEESFRRMMIQRFQHGPQHGPQAGDHKHGQCHGNCHKK